MHRLVSQISALVLSPFNWILLLVVIALLIRNRRYKRILNISALVIFLLFSNSFLLNWLSSKWQTNRGAIQPGRTYSCGIVLGGFASVDADSVAYFNGAADRFIQVLKLYKTGAIQNILVSGGNGKKENAAFGEASFVRNELITLGVPDSVITIEDKSNNTADNAKYARRILDSMQLSPPYLLITSASHMPRATLLFNKAGIKTEAYACNFSAGHSGFSLMMLLPDPGVLKSWDGYLKEVVGYWWYK